MLEFIIKYWLEFFFGALLTLMGYFFKKQAEKTKENRIQLEALKNGTQCLLRSEIIRCYEKYAEQQYCPIYVREAVMKAYKAYHDLGGNDVATDLIQKIQALPAEAEQQID